MNKINLTLTTIVIISLGYVYLNTQEQVSSIISQQVEMEEKLSSIISQQVEVKDEIDNINFSLSKLPEVDTQLKNHKNNITSLENKLKDFEEKILDEYINQKESLYDTTDLGDEDLYSDGFICNLKVKYFKERCNYIFKVFSENEGDILDIYPTHIKGHEIVLSDKDGFLIDTIYIKDEDLFHNSNTNLFEIEGNLEMEKNDYLLIDGYIHNEISD